MHPWGKFEDKSVKQMVVEAGNRAIEDAGVRWRDIGFVGAASPLFEGGMDYGLAANELLLAVSASGVPVYNVSAGCAAGGSYGVTCRRHDRKGRGAGQADRMAPGWGERSAKACLGGPESL